MKRISILVGRPGEGNLHLVPFGRYCNSRIADMERGDLLVFQQGWRETECRLLRKARVTIDTQLGDFLSRHIYGERTDAAALKTEWDAQVMIEGAGGYGGEVWLLETRPYDPEKEKREEIERKEREEAIRASLEAEAERERVIELARKGIAVVHPDVLP